MGNNLVKTEQSTAINHMAVPEKMFELALSSDTGIEKLERIMVMQEQASAKQARSEYLHALSLFQSKCPKIKKLKKGHNSMYAPLEDIIEQVKELLFDCGLSYSFSQEQEDNKIQVSCHMSHIGGHTETVSLVSEHDKSGNKQAIQALASAISYLRRYTFTGVTGIVPSDEDSDGRIADSQFKPCTAEQISRIDEAVNLSGKDEQVCGNYVNSKLGISVANWAQLSLDQAEAAISILEKFNAGN